jgi:hypothetical protein
MGVGGSDVGRNKRSAVPAFAWDCVWIAGTALCSILFGTKLEGTILAAVFVGGRDD